MDTKGNPGKPGLTDVILIDDQSTLIIADVLRIVFRNRKSFRLVWIVCEAWLSSQRYQELGGVPPEEVEDRCREEGAAPSRNAVNTRWRDEVEFRCRRPHDEKEVEARVQQCLYVAELRPGMLSPGISSERLAIEKLRSVFYRGTDPSESGVKHHPKLFSVRAEPNRVCLFKTAADAAAFGVRPSGVTAWTKFRITPWHFGLFYERHKVRIDDEGDQELVVSLKLMNLTPYSIHRFSFPLRTSRQLLSDKVSPRAWLEDHTPLHTQVATREANGYTGQVLEVFFASQVGSGQTVGLSYSLAHVGTYRPGENNYSVCIDRPCTRFSLDLSCASSWSISDPMVLLPYKERDDIQPKQVDDNHLMWERSFPIPMWKYEFCFYLSSKGCALGPANQH